MTSTEAHFVFETLLDGRRAYEKLGGIGEGRTCFIFKAWEQSWSDDLAPYRRLTLANGLEIQCLVTNDGRYIPNELQFFGLEYGQYVIRAASSADRLDPLVSWQCEAVSNEENCFMQILNQYSRARKIRFENRNWNRMEGLMIFRIKCVLGLIDPLDYDNVRLTCNPDAPKIALNRETWFPVWRMLAYSRADENEWSRYRFPKEIDQDLVNACFARAVRDRRVTTELLKRTKDASEMSIPAVVGPARMYLKKDDEFRKVILEWCRLQRDYIGWVCMNGWDFSVLSAFGSCPVDSIQIQEMLMYFEDWMLDRSEFCDWEKGGVKELVKVTVKRILCSFPCDWRFAPEHDVYVTVSHWNESRRLDCIKYCREQRDEDVKKFGQLVWDINSRIVHK